MQRPEFLENRFKTREYQLIIPATQDSYCLYLVNPVMTVRNKQKINFEFELERREDQWVVGQPYFYGAWKDIKGIMLSNAGSRLNTREYNRNFGDIKKSPDNHVYFLPSEIFKEYLNSNYKPICESDTLEYIVDLVIREVDNLDREELSYVKRQRLSPEYFDKFDPEVDFSISTIRDVIAKKKAKRQPLSLKISNKRSVLLPPRT